MTTDPDASAPEETTAAPQPVSSPQPARPRVERGRGPGLLFHLAAASTVAFIITVLALVATLFGDPQAPVNLWLDAWGTVLLGGEMLLILTFGIAAMAHDQWLQQSERPVVNRTDG